MNFVISFIKKWMPKDIQRPLGRWGIVNNKQMNHKIDLSNEDHCGPCGEYTLEKLKSKKISDFRLDSPKSRTTIIRHLERAQKM